MLGASSGSAGIAVVPFFSTGVDVIQEDLPAVLDELVKLKKWALIQGGGERIEQLVTRIELLGEELPMALRREDVVIYIG